MHTRQRRQRQGEMVCRHSAKSNGRVDWDFLNTTYFGEWRSTRMKGRQLPSSKRPAHSSYVWSCVQVQVGCSTQHVVVGVMCEKG